MSKLILLWLVFVLGLVWLLFPYDPNPDNWIAFFPLSDQKLPWQNYVFHACEKLIFVIFSWVILQESDKYRFALWVFFGIQVLRFGDYFLTYNEVWGYPLDGVPLTSTTLGMIVFGLCIVYELWKKR